MFERWKRRFGGRKVEASKPQGLAGDEDLEGPALAGPSEAEEPARVVLGQVSLAKPRKYSSEERERHLAQHMASKLSVREYCEREGFPRTTLESWLRAQRKGTKLERKPHKRYSPEERRAAVEACLKSERSRYSFALLWGCSKASLDKWILRYKAEGPKGLEDRDRKQTEREPHPARLPEASRDLIVKVRGKKQSWVVDRSH